MQPKPPPPPDRTYRVLDHDTVLEERGWQLNAHLSPEQRIRLIEHLRRMWHGEDTLNRRLPRVLELTQRAPR